MLLHFSFFVGSSNHRGRLSDYRVILFFYSKPRPPALGSVGAVVPGPWLGLATISTQSLALDGVWNRSGFEIRAEVHVVGRKSGQTWKKPKFGFPFCEEISESEILGGIIGGRHLIKMIPIESHLRNGLDNSVVPVGCNLKSSIAAQPRTPLVTTSYARARAS